MIVLALVAPASADVDWSAYIDHSARTTPAAAPAKTSRAKISKRATKKVAKAKIKARTKSKKTRLK